jgi:acyl-[acyl-carrier-protein]-phospholipid O-acyltransferase/long-chain-fatty-acid--[acyl-carrier-protein] ligase
MQNNHNKTGEKMQLHLSFIRIAKQFKSKIAIHDIATEKVLTYEKMLIASLILKKKFNRFKGQYLGILVPTSAGGMLSIISTLMAGKIPVMINYSTGARENCIYAQNKCNFRPIVTSKKLLAKLNIEPLEDMIFLEDIMKSLSLFDKLKAAIISKLPVPVIEKFVYSGPIDDTCVILFTSGSENEPKAVQLSHKNIMHNVLNIPLSLEVESDDVYLANLPLFHVFGLTVNCWLPLLTGATIVAYPNPLDYKVICDVIRDYKVQIMAGTPAFFLGYLRKSQPGDFASVRIAVAGADKLTLHIFEGFMQKHNLKILEGYGTTETSPVISANTLAENRLGSIGKPICGVDVKIVDRETDELLPTGQEGKILVRGDMVMKGYLGDLEQTSLRIHNGWYDTGDIGKIDTDGFLWHCGRLKRFVKIGGEMISLVKVESVLEKYLPPDAVCCVVDVPNPKKGADIVAALTTSEINTKKILKMMALELPAIALPKQFHYIETIPMMTSGKVNFREVERICRSYVNNEKM